MITFQNFAAEFIILLIIKDWEIENSIHAINSNADDLIIIKDDDMKMHYKIEENEKNIKQNEYETINSEKKDNNKIEKKIIELFN